MKKDQHSSEESCAALETRIKELEHENILLRKRLDERLDDQEALARNESRYRNISSLISSVAYSCKYEDGTFKFDWLAGSVSKTFGYSTEEMYSNGCWKSLVLPEDVHLFEKNISNLQPGEKSNFELRIRAKDGSVRWINSVAECIDESNGIALYGGIIDITDNKNTGKNLALIREDLEEAQYIAKLGSWEYVVESEEFRFSGETRKIFGFDENKDPLKWSDFRSVIFENDWKEFEEKLKRMIGGETEQFSHELRIRNNGETRWAHTICKLKYSENGTMKNAKGTIQDVTPLRMSELQLDALFNSAPVIMILLNERTEILRINKFGVESTGRSMESITGLKIGDVLRCVNSYRSPGGCSMARECKRCDLRRTTEETFSAGIEHFKVEAQITVDGESQEAEHTILVSTSIISTIPEKQVLVTIDDISERKMLENELIEARDKAQESDRLKSAFLANISHEIRTPMNGIMGFSEMLTKSGISEDKRVQFSSLIQDGCRQLLGIITDVIEISMLDSGQITAHNSEFDLNEFMQDVYLHFRSAASNKNLDLNVSKGCWKAKIETDKEKLKHIFSDLLSNAVKFTKQGNIEFGYTIDNADIQFFVKDTGIGISKDLFEVIFERFRQAETSDTRNYGGTGLGLSIAKGLAQLLGGKIWLESEPSRGSTFYFTIDCKCVLSEERESDIVTDDNEILIAEDDDINYLFMQEVLLDVDCTPYHARNGAEALRILDEHPGIKLVFMDLKMPVMDGYEATRTIKRLYPFLPVYAQTAYTMPFGKEEMKDLGFTGIISKPIDKVKLEAIIKKYVGESVSRDTSIKE